MSPTIELPLTGEPRQQRVVLVGEVDAEQRGEQAAQPEILDQHDLAAAHAAAAGNIERQRQPAPGAVQARQRGAARSQRRRRSAGSAGSKATPIQPAEPVQMLLRERSPDRSAGARRPRDPRAASARLEAGEEADEEVGAAWRAAGRA